MARQIAAYAERFKKLTVPELCEAAKRRNLDTSGKRQQLLVRLSIWVRDELATVAPEEEKGKEDKTQDKFDCENAPDEAVPLRTEGLEARVVDYIAESDDDSGKASASDDDVEEEEEEELEIVDALTGNARTNTAQNLPDSRASRDAQHSDHDIEVDSVADEDELHMDTTRESKPANIMHSTLKTLFGYSELREGQEWAIRRCMEKKKTLLVAPTGFGKSMCYVIPAFLLDGVCIVVSPLISLIQVSNALKTALLAVSKSSAS
jgi:hypothetical protein